MTSRDRDAAERLSRDLARPRRTRVDAGADANDEEYAALLDLGSELESIELQPSPDFRDELSRRIAVLSEADPRTSSPLRDCFHTWMFPGSHVDTMARIRLALCAAALLIGILIVPRLGPFRAVSAADVLTRAQHAIASRIGPGDVMFRRWRIVERFSDRAGGPERVEVRYLDEWIDGGDIKHAASKSLDASGRLSAAYIRERAGDSYVQRVYYAPGIAGEPRGLLSIVPDRPQFESAAARFSGQRRLLLDEYLRRGYGPYEPLMREFRANEAALANGSQGLAFSPVTVLLEKPVRLERESVYRVRVVEPVRVQFRWTSQGAPNMWLDRGESVRYVSAQTYLSHKIETTSTDENGRRVVASREVVDMRISHGGTPNGDPFRLDVREGTPVREQSAFDYLTAVATALQRAAAFQAAQEPNSTMQIPPRRRAPRS